LGTKTKLNLGCGTEPIEGYCNVDIRDLPGVDLVCDIREMVWPEECFDEILAVDIIEHLSFQEAETLLKQCHRWLKSGGCLTVSTPNLVHITHMLCISSRLGE
jgi:predicted SAM-dependent methyltransferase